MSEENPTPEEIAADKAAKEARAAALKVVQDKADITNKTRTGKGTRVLVGQTRGRSVVPFSYEAFDKSLADTLPVNTSEFMDLVKPSDEQLTAYLIEGYNSFSLEKASDPVAEYVDLTWPEDIQTRFRLVVRNYANGANVSIEDAVSLIKPGIDAAAKASRLATAAK